MRVTVCLIASHPLLQAEFERLLPPREFRLLTHRLPPLSGATAPAVSPPRASVYAIDSQRTRELTQELIAAIGASPPGPRVLVLGETFHEEEAFPLLRLGIKGMLTYSEVAHQLARALREVARGGFWVPRGLLSRFVDSAVNGLRRPPISWTERHLSRREREVAELLLENFSNKEIARRLGVSERTAKFHVSNLLAKFRVKRRADLILLSFDPGNLSGAKPA